MVSTMRTVPPAETAAARFFRVLGDPTRLAILELLDAPRTVTELVGALGLPRSRVSNHLACLRWCGFVATERVGRQVAYRLVDPRVRDVLDAARIVVTDHHDRLASCTRMGPEWV